MSEFFDTQKKYSLPKQQIEQVEKQKHEFKLIGKQRAVPGHTMFSFNIKTGEIKIAPMKYEAAIDMRTRQPIRKRSIVIEKDCIYRQALNKKNLIKRLLREGWLTKKYYGKD